MSDLPRNAQEVADVLKLGEGNAALLWTRWFEAVAPTEGQTDVEDAQLARARAEAAEAQCRLASCQGQCRTRPSQH